MRSEIADDPLQISKRKDINDCIMPFGTKEKSSCAKNRHAIADGHGYPA